MIILDEVQELAGFQDSPRIEKGLRAIVQRLKNTTVFYSGSLPSILRDMFFDKKRPFYQSAIKVLLDFTPLEEVRKYLTQKFSISHEACSPVFIEKLASLTEGHPYYVQLVGHFAWEHFEKKGTWLQVTTDEILTSLFQQERVAFENAISILSPVQRLVFRAIAREPNQPVTGMDFLTRQFLPGHSSVRKAVTRLEAVGFLLRRNPGYVPADPLLARWWSQEK